MLKKMLLLIPLMLLNSCQTSEIYLPEVSIIELAKEKKIQKELVLKTYEEHVRRIQKVAYPILSKNADLCPETGLSDGMVTWNKYYFPKKERKLGAELFNLTEKHKIKQIFKDSPASKAGLKEGDIVISMDDIDISGRKGYKKFIKKFNKSDKLEFDIVVQRGTDILEMVLSPSISCAYDIVYDTKNSDVNASANGIRIKISRPMYYFARTDDELATVIGHELAHNTLKHPQKAYMDRSTGKEIGYLIDSAAHYYGLGTSGFFEDLGEELGDLAKSPKYEHEADYVGLYFTARAGYNSDAAGNFWRRMSSEVDEASIEIKSSHPTNPERFISLSKAHKEIMNKINKGEELRPKMKIRKNFGLGKPQIKN